MLVIQSYRYLLQQSSLELSLRKAPTVCRTNIKRSCSKLVQVAGLHRRGDLAQLDSLNVSVATGILLHQLLT